MKLVYLATPYTRYPNGLDAAFEDAAAIAGALIKRGLAVFSPICHSHPIAKHGGIDAVDHDLWMRIDREMWERCDELLVAKMHGWDQSRGIAAEIEYFLSHGKPVTYTEVGAVLAPRAGPDYDPASVAFRHGDLGWLGEAAVSEVCASCGLGDVPEKVRTPTAAELADADGVSEYGNPVTPGCATPARQSDSWGVSYGGKRP